MEGTGLTEEELRILLGAAQGRSLTNSGDGAGDGEAPSLTINLNEHEDGERSNNKGPCPCGYRHYLEGKEHDWVFKIPTTKGNKLLGYSLGENPYIAAKTFIEKHQIGLGNEREYIEYVAQLIISTTASATPAAGAPLTTSAPIFNPYASNEPVKKIALASPSGATQVTDSAAEAKRKKEIEDAQNRLRAEKLRQEQEKEKIKERIRQDRENQKREREAQAKKLEEMRRQADAGHTPVVPRPNLISPVGSASSIIGGDVMMNTQQQQQHHDTPHGSASSLAPPSGVPAPARTPSPRTPQFAPLNNPIPAAQRSSGGGVTKFGGGSDSDSDGDAGPPKPKEEWTLQDLKDYLRIEGETGLMARLVSAHFSEQEIIKFFNLAVRMKAMEDGDAVSGIMPTGVSGKMPPPQRPAAFQSAGYRLGGSDTPTPTPAPAASAAPSFAAGPVSFANVVATGSATPTADIVVDDSKPKTQIQIRLGDGTRLVATFNHTHTIADIRQHIQANRPNATRGSDYDLIIQHPRKVLSDLNVSIEAAGLLKGVIIQTPK